MVIGCEGRGCGRADGYSMGIKCLGGCEHIGQAGVGWCVGIGLSAFGFPAGVAGGGVSDPVPGVSPGGAGAGDVGSRFPSVVPFGPDQLCP